MAGLSFPTFRLLVPRRCRSAGDGSDGLAERQQHLSYSSGAGRWSCSCSSARASRAPTSRRTPRQVEACPSSRPPSLLLQHRPAAWFAGLVGYNHETGAGQRGDNVSRQCLRIAASLPLDCAKNYALDLARCRRHEYHRFSVIRRIGAAFSVYSSSG